MGTLPIMLLNKMRRCHRRHSGIDVTIHYHIFPLKIQLQSKLSFYIIHQLKSVLPSMNVSNFLGPIGVNGALTEEGRAQLEGIIAHHQQIVIKIEAEAAIALEVLKTMTKQRNEAHTWLASLSTTADKVSLPHVIKHEEILLGDIDE